MPKPTDVKEPKKRGRPEGSGVKSPWLKMNPEGK